MGRSPHLAGPPGPHPWASRRLGSYDDRHARGLSARCGDAWAWHQELEMADVAYLIESTIEDGKTADFTQQAEAYTRAMRSGEPGTLEYQWWPSDDATRWLAVGTPWPSD